MAIKKYTNGSWVSASFRKYGTETDAITTLPATVIGDGTPISSYTIKGNMEQNGTPTPENPIMPRWCGELETTGAHAGQYKLPILSNSTVTNIYLGEVQTTRRIKKLVLTGEETWSYSDSSNAPFKLNLMDRIRLPLPTSTYWVCSHYEAVSNSASWTSYDSCISWSTIDGSDGLRFRDIRYSNLDDFKAYLAQQYAAGTPVTIWYVLAEPETAVVNEPICKIDDYVDSVSGTNLATSGAAQEFDVGTTLKPSEVDLTYHGWHEHEDTKYST